MGRYTQAVGKMVIQRKRLVHGGSVLIQRLGERVIRIGTSYNKKALPDGRTVP
ncbi:hypothetical protein BN2364_2318 [Alloalcanivorax xenomutans]|nr:hypothetical protein BN2364_2318 [Alloalcanivorax xenomutans]